MLSTKLQTFHLSESAKWKVWKDLQKEMQKGKGFINQDLTITRIQGLFPSSGWSSYKYHSGEEQHWHCDIICLKWQWKWLFRGRWEGGLGWGIHVNTWLIHINVWQTPLQYCKVLSLQLIKINGKKKEGSRLIKRKVLEKRRLIFKGYFLLLGIMWNLGA